MERRWLRSVPQENSQHGRGSTRWHSDAPDQGSRQADRYLLDVAPGLLESRDVQYAVELLLTQGARKFTQNHAQVMFEGR